VASLSRGVGDLTLLLVKLSSAADSGASRKQDRRNPATANSADENRVPPAKESAGTAASIESVRTSQALLDRGTSRAVGFHVVEDLSMTAKTDSIFGQKLFLPSTKGVSTSPTMTGSERLDQCREMRLCCCLCRVVHPPKRRCGASADPRIFWGFASARRRPKSRAEKCRLGL